MRHAAAEVTEQSANWDDKSGSDTSTFGTSCSGNRTSAVGEELSATLRGDALRSCFCRGGKALASKVMLEAKGSEKV